MSIDRNAIMQAVADLLRSKMPDVVTVGRRHIMPPDLAPSDQPAVFVCQVKETKDPELRGTPGKVTIRALLFVYATGPGTNDFPGYEEALAETQIQSVLGSIENALAADDIDGVQNLGGLVHHCWIDGDTDIDPGIFGQQAAAIVPVSILVP